MGNSIGVALIAKNVEKTLGRCLGSVRPHVSQIVVGVDLLSEDRTAEIAREAGADKVFPVQVSFEHECPQHGKVLAQHFAQARTQSFVELDPQLDFWMWLDADDIVENPELLGKLCEDVSNSSAIGAWLPYDYARIGDVTNTKFHRERLLRTKFPDGQRIDWQWEHRVHETISAKNVRNPQWLMREKPIIVHQGEGHDPKRSSERNILLLEIDLEENPQDARAIFYMGNQYFAMGDMPRAAYWYERIGEVGQNQYEKWQSWVYCSIAYERMGDLDNALKAAFAAIDVRPEHPEPYHRLASIYLLSGELEKVEFWTKQASMETPPPPKTSPPFFCFKNPLDYSFNSKMPLADAYAAQGRIKEAKQVLLEAYSALPEPRVAEAIKGYQEIEEAEKVASSFVTLLEGKSDADILRLYDFANLPEKVRAFGRVRNLVMPALIRNRKSTPRVVFWCNRAYEEWSPLSLTRGGIGGSETAVVEIARRFAQDGWQVDVYNGAGSQEGEYETVGYWDPERLKPREKCDLFVSWRQPKALLDLECPKAILWCHDLNYGPEVSKFIQTWASTPGAVVCGVSAWHAEMLKKYYDLPRADFVPNGVDISLFGDDAPKKEPFQLVYASSPDRGLDRLVRLWPRLKKREPGLSLKIAYGWNNIDKMIAMGRQDLAEFKDKLLKMTAMDESIQWLGRLNKQEVANLYRESAVWAYPTSFLEVSCISAMEAMAGGAVPVTSTWGALPETIGDAGLLVPGQPDAAYWQEMWVESLIGCLTSPQIQWVLRAKARQRAFEFTWDLAYAKWKQVVENLGSATHAEEMVGV